MTGPAARPPRRVAAVLAVVALALAVGCSDDDGDAGATDAPTTTTEVEEFTGSVEDFYVVPDPLPSGPPGTLVRTMAVEADAGTAAWRVMYLSTDAEGDDRAVTGLIRHPTAAAPEGGWPVLAWAHGTTGLAAACAPSRGAAFGPDLGVQGVQVATDYIGLGPEGELHPYLSKEGEAHAVIDGVAAARSLPAAHAGDRWAVVGVSQGGHAALVTNELAAERLPDAELVGAVAVAPGAQLGDDYGDAVQIRIITTMVLFGVAAEDPSVDPADYLAPEALAAARVIEEGCVTDVISALPALAGADDYFTIDPRDDAVGREWVAHNDPGQVAADSPLLLVQGLDDVLVVPDRTRALFDRLCGVGQVVELVEVPGADHATVTGVADARIRTWVADRFAGDLPVDSC